MGKKKKVTGKVAIFYRGLTTKPTRVADENDMQIICNALRECLTRRDCAFETIWNSENINLRLIAGLSASLRSLRQKRTRALIYCDTAGLHLTNYLKEFAFKIQAPIIQASRLIDISLEFNLKSLLVVSIVESVSGNEVIYLDKYNPKPKPIKEIIKSESFDKLCHWIQSSHRQVKQEFDHAETTSKNP